MRTGSRRCVHEINADGVFCVGGVSRVDVDWSVRHDVPMRQQREAKDIQEKVLKVIQRNEGERSITEIRVISWVIDGKVMAPGLEKREKFKTEEGERSGKAKAFSMADLILIQNNWDEIIAVMQGRPSELRQQRQPIGNAAKPEPF